MTAKLSIGRIQSNSKLVSAKHWTYQTLYECIHTYVMILPIEKYNLLNQALARFFCGFQLQILCQNLLNATNSAKFGANPLAEH